jgi:creatinine deaminase
MRHSGENMDALEPDEQKIFEEAYRQAQKSLDEGGIPIGAALGLKGKLVASGHNERIQRGDPIAHAEIACLRNAGRRRDYRRMTLYSTLAPCDMCTGAVLLFGIPRVVAGEAETFPGMIDYLKARGVEVVLLNDARCVALMRDFQQRWPKAWQEDIGE